MTNTRPPVKAQLYVHVYGYRYRMRYDPAFSVFDLIKDAGQRGFDGINISVYGPDYLFLGHSVARDHLRRLREALCEARLGVDIESNGTDPVDLRELMEIGRQLGAQNLRTYTRDRGDRDANMRMAIRGLREASRIAEDAGMVIALENHEDLTGEEVAHVISEVDSPWVRGLFDYGNCTVFMEHPFDALQSLLPFVVTSHLKDQVFVPAHGALPPRTLGVPIGDGTIPVRTLTERLLNAGVPRICFENVWAYVTPVVDTRGRKSDCQDDVFSPAAWDPEDDRYCTDSARLEQSRPEYLTATETVMLDRSCYALERILGGLPISLPHSEGGVG